MPAGTPNDGLPENWKAIDEPPVIVGERGFEPHSGPPVGPAGPDKFFAASIPSGFQLEPDMMPTRYAGGLGAYRIMPPIASADPALNSAIQSIIAQQKT